MTKQEMIEARVQQLIAENWSGDLARVEAERLYANVEDEAPVVEAPKRKAKEVKAADIVAVAETKEGE